MIKSKPVGPQYEKAVVAAMGEYKRTKDISVYKAALHAAECAQDAAIERGGFPLGYRCSTGLHTATKPHVAGLVQAHANAAVRAGDVICLGHAVPIDSDGLEGSAHAK
jgi:hypothetical protein